MHEVRIGGLAVALLLVTGCGNGGTPAEDPENRSALVLVTEPEPSVGFSERVPIQVRYVDSDQVPRAGVLVAFDAQQDPGDSTFSASKVATDSNGTAETTLDGGTQQLDFDVRISVPSDDTVDPITVRVRIQPKSSADFLLRVSHQGPLTGNRVIVSVYEADRPCATPVPSPTDPPSPDVPWAELVILPDAQGGIPDRGLVLPAGVRLRYAVARGEPTDGSSGGADYYGCVDSIPDPDPARQVPVEIVLLDL